MAIHVVPVERRKMVWGSTSTAQEARIGDAAASFGGVLITGPPDRADAIAREIHRRGKENGRPFKAVDCRDPECLQVLDRRDMSDGGTVLLREIGELIPPQQAKLMWHLPNPRWRFIGTSRECPRTRLAPKLFHYLNVVNITLDTTA